ncbi:hypothetical protein GCM10023237_20000 [Streptomyces coeruleoprunus]
MPVGAGSAAVAAGGAASEATPATARASAAAFVLAARPPRNRDPYRPSDIPSLTFTAEMMDRQMN